MKTAKVLLTLVVTMMAPLSYGVTIAAVGDIMMGSNYNQDGLPNNGGQELFLAAQPYLQTTDLKFGNLEGPLFDGAHPADGKPGGANRYVFRTPTRLGARLAEAGFNVLSLANNHAKDFGRAGLESSKRTLSQLGISFSSKDGEVATFKFGEVTVALIATDFYSGQRSITNPEVTLAEITNLKSQYNIVIVSSHAGGEGENAARTRNQKEIFLGENRGNSIDFAHRAIEAGADLILMHGPHVPRGMEVYHDRLVVYSLGNFVTGKGINVAGRSGLAPLARIELADDGRFIKGHLASFRQTRERALALDETQEAMKFIAQVSAVDFPQSQPEFNSKGYFRARPVAPSTQEVLLRP